MLTRNGYEGAAALEIVRSLENRRFSCAVRRTIGLTIAVAEARFGTEPMSFEDFAADVEEMWFPRGRENDR